MYRKMSIRAKITIPLAVLCVAALFVFVRSTGAATLTSLTDLMSNPVVSEASNHTFSFVTPTGVDDPSDTITITFNSFTLGSIGNNEIDLFYGPVTGYENEKTLAASAAAGVWGVSISGETLTLTAPTDAAAGEIPAGSVVSILIGTHASGGVEQIVNPSSTTTSFQINLAGTFGDSGDIAVPIVDNDTVVVTAEYPTVENPPSGGEGGDSTPPAIFNVQSSSTSLTSVVITWQTDEASNSRVDYGHTLGYASGTVSDASLVLTHEIELTGLIACQTYFFRVRSSDMYNNEAIAGGYSFTLPCDTYPPLLSNIRAENITDSSVMILWDSNEPATSVVNYGLTAAYGSQSSAVGFVTSHAVPIAGLEPNTTYHFQVVSTDAYGNITSSADYMFTTIADVTPPSNVTLTATPGDGQVELSWTIPPDADFAGVRIVRRTDGFPSGPTDGTLIYDGTGTSVTDTAVVNGTTYYYGAYAYDTSGNFASGALAAAQPTGPPDTTPPSNVGLTATPGNTIVTLTWTEPPDPDYTGVRIVYRTDAPPTGPFDGMLVYSGPATSAVHSGLTNGTTYYYGAYAYDASGNYASGAFASATPSAELPPEVPPPSVPPPEVPPPEVPPPSVPPPTAGVTTTAPTPGAVMTVHLYGSGGTLPLVADASGIVNIPATEVIRVSAPLSGMNGVPDIVVFVLGDATYNLRYDPETNSYEGTAPAPGFGTYAAKGQAVFADGRVAESAFTIRVLGSGRVFERPLVGTPSVPVPDATIYLYTEQAGEWVLWNGAPYGQSNPTRTSENGAYIFKVPPGRYYAEVEKEGFNKRVTNPVFVDNNLFNETITLIKKPLTIQEIIEEAVSTTATPIEAAVDVVENIGEQVAYQVKRIQETIIESPIVQEVNREIVSPAALTVTVVNAASALTVFNLLAYLQYLFTQPLLLLWRRRRKGFGVVYNALTKQPVDLAIVRLIHIDSGLTVQTRVTDKHGRYVLSVKPGTYRIEISKPNFIFPSSYMKGKKADIDFADLYGGERIEVKEDGILSLNIPIDPIVAEETPRRVLFKRVLRKLQHVVAFSGVIISIIAFAITPTVPMGLFIVSQVFIYFIFRRLSLPSKPKNWGVIYDKKNRKPLTRAIVRIYDSKFNKLLETQVTDGKGRYGFLVGKNVYYLTGAAKGYESKKTDNIDLSKAKEGLVKQDIGLEKTASNKKPRKIFGLGKK